MRRSVHEYKTTRSEKTTRKKSGLKGVAVRTIGNLFILFAIFGILATFGPAVIVETQFRINEARGVKFTVANKPAPQVSGFANFFNLQTEQTLSAPDPYFSLIIPKIGAAAKVIPNVDPNNQDEYVKALQKGIAHAKGSVAPDSPAGTTFLFAHSTDNFWDVGRYNAVFYLLKDLNLGDNIVVFYKGVRYNYEVVDRKIVNPEDVGYLNNAQKTRKQLVLQSCWPPGTTWRRIIVVAYPAIAN